MKKKLNVLYILGSGGHTAQMIELSKDLKEKINYFYLIQKDDVLSQKKIIYPDKIIRIKRNADFNENKLNIFLKTIFSFFKAIKIINKNKINVIISCGPGVSIPFFYAGFLLRKKLIFIESWLRLTSKSISGKLIYLIANLFFVQWKENLTNYPKALYRGRFK
jgi:UDP-N-acetylglucosamine:LPS N-acetylglucosamine transferase